MWKNLRLLKYNIETTANRNSLELFDKWNRVLSKINHIYLLGCYFPFWKYTMRKRKSIRTNTPVEIVVVVPVRFLQVFGVTHNTDPIKQSLLLNHYIICIILLFVLSANIHQWCINTIISINNDQLSIQQSANSLNYWSWCERMCLCVCVCVCFTSCFSFECHDYCSKYFMTRPNKSLNIHSFYFFCIIFILNVFSVIVI